MFTALWIAKTMPVKTAAVSATPTERTPMTSISLITRRKYLGGSATLRATCAVSSPTPPYQIAVRLRNVSISLHGEALHEAPEVAAPGLERVRGRDVQEVVHTAPVLQEVAFDADALVALARPALDHPVVRRTTGQVGLALFERRAISQAEQEVTLQEIVAPARRLRPARGVGQHARAPVIASQREIRTPIVHDAPSRTGKAHPIAMLRVENPVVDSASRAPGRDDGESDGHDERRAPGAGAHAGYPPGAARSRCRRASSSRTSRSGIPRFPSSTSVWNQRSATSETTRASPSPPSAAVTTSVASSPIFRHTAASPLASSPATYEPSAGAAFRSCTIRSMRSSMLAVAPAPDSALTKHVRAPVWQATPSWWTWTTSVSASQSA